MLRSHLFLIYLLIGLCAWQIPARVSAAGTARAETDVRAESEDETDVNAVTDQGRRPPSAAPGVDVGFSGENSVLLFTPGPFPTLHLRLLNHSDDPDADVTVRCTTSTGIQLFEYAQTVPLPKNAAKEVTITPPAPLTLPNGAYQIEAWVKTRVQAQLGYGSALFGVWKGPAETPGNLFGINYAGAPTAERLWRDLELFQQAGIGWLRFPMLGWLPQGAEVPASVQVYDKLVQEAGLRGINLVAVLTPQLTNDPAVNPIQAEKEYHESLLAAITRYGFRIKHWELPCVKPDPRFPDLRGIDYKLVLKGREVIRQYDSSLHVLFSIDPAFSPSARALFMCRLPNKGDLLGFRFAFTGIPEDQENTPYPPLHDLPGVLKTARSMLKHTPSAWISEYRLDPSRCRSVPRPVYQAALITRALILARVHNIERTFWRHDVDSPYDLPFTGPDGSPQASLLAVRTTQEMLDGATRIEPVASPFGRATSDPLIHAYLLSRTVGGAQRHTLVMWCENAATALTVQSRAHSVTVTDLWGNNVTLTPVAGSVLVQVDEQPRFLELDAADRLKLAPPFAECLPACPVLRDGAVNTLTFELRPGARLGHGPLTGTFRCRIWPGDTPPLSEPFTVTEKQAYTHVIPLAIPAQARIGQELCRVQAEVFVGESRVGYLEVPVWYAQNAMSESMP